VLILDNVDQALLQPAFLSKLKTLTKSDLGPLVLVSLHPLPGSVAPLFLDLPVPRLGSVEIREMMRLHGTPLPVLGEGLGNLVEGVTHGMPDLVTLLLKDWRAKGWARDDDAWISLLNSCYAQDLRSETQRRLLALEDTDTCELLYRLTLLGRDFSEQEVVEIAGLVTPIGRAGERLHSVSGRWLHRVRDGRWRTSPLLAKTGENNLSRTTRKQVHTTAANWILKKGTLSQLDVQQAVMHLMQAERLDEAAMVLLRALHSFCHADENADSGMILSLWKGLTLPCGMALGLRVAIRGLQVAVAFRRSEDYAYALTDMLSLIRKSKDPRDKAAIYASSGLIAMQLALTDPMRALPFITVAAQSERQLPEEVKSALKGHTATGIFWAAAMRARSIAEVDAWMEEVAKLSDTDRQVMMTTEFAADSASSMFEHLWWSEQAKPEEGRDWPAVLACLERSQQTAASWNTPLISACILRARLAVLLVHLHQVDTAMSEAEVFYRVNQNHDLAAFLISDGSATWLLDLDRWDLAGTWLTRAYAYTGPELPLHRQQTSLRYGNLLFRSGAASIVPFERAIAITEQSEKLTHVNLTKARCELATFQWLTGDENGCFQTWSLVARDLLDQPEHTPQWKHLFVLAGNSTAFFSSSLETREAKKELVAAPRLGVFISGVQSLAERYLPALTFLLPGGMSQWAAHLCGDRDASVWAEQATPLDQGLERNAAADVYQMHALPLDLKEERFIDALRHSDLSSRGRMSNVYSSVPAARQAELDIATLMAAGERVAKFARLYALHTGLLPVLIATLVPTETNRNSVRVTLEQLTDHVRSLSQGSPVAWDIGLEVLEDLLSGRIVMSDVEKDRPQVATPDQAVRAVLRSVAIWFSEKGTARDQFFAQVYSVAYLSNYFKHTGSLGLKICEAFARLWSTKIEHSPYHFRQPRETVKRVREAASSAHLGRMFMVLADSLNVSTGTEVRAQFEAYVLREQPSS